MRPTEQERAGQSVAAQISTAVVSLMREYTGRGPTKARTTITEDVVLVLIGDGDIVLEMRRRFQQTMGEELTATVSRLTGRRVIAFMSANHLDPDLGAEIFVLEPRPSADGAGPATSQGREESQSEDPV